MMDRAEFEKQLNEFTISEGVHQHGGGDSYYGESCAAELEGLDNSHCCLNMKHVRDFLFKIIEDAEDEASNAAMDSCRYAEE